MTQFRTRANRVKKRLEHPPSPESFSVAEPDPDAATGPGENSKILRKLVFEDFDAELYASQSTIDFR